MHFVKVDRLHNARMVRIVIAKLIKGRVHTMEVLLFGINEKSKMFYFLLILSTICFITACGIHLSVKDTLDIGIDTTYRYYPIKNILPWISGFVLAVIPETMLFNIFFLWMFLINIAIVMILGPLFTNMYLQRFATGKGPWSNILTSVVIGIVTLIIAIFIN